MREMWRIDATASPTQSVTAICRSFFSFFSSFPLFLFRVRSRQTPRRKEKLFFSAADVNEG